MKNYIGLFKTLGMSALLTVAPALFAAAPYTSVSEIFPPDPAANQFFGFAAVISDDVAVVGAPFTTNGAPAQTMFAFQRSDVVVAFCGTVAKLGLLRNFVLVLKE